jgi:hypothetical protein
VDECIDNPNYNATTDDRDDCLTRTSGKPCYPNDGPVDDDWVLQIKPDAKKYCGYDPAQLKQGKMTVGCHTCSQCENTESSGIHVEFCVELAKQDAFCEKNAAHASCKKVTDPTDAPTTTTSVMAPTNPSDPVNTLADGSGSGDAPTDGSGSNDGNPNSSTTSIAVGAATTFGMVVGIAMPMLV